MGFEPAQIVRSRAGHDAGRLYCVIRVEGDFLYLADGKHKKLENPKRKRARHVEAAGSSEHPAIQRLHEGEPVLNSDIRRALAAVRSGGNHTWQKTI